MNAKSVKVIRKVERPRPLRSLTSSDVSKYDFSKETTEPKKNVSEVIPELERIYIALRSNDFDERTAENIVQICNILKTHGKELDLSKKSDRLTHAINRGLTRPIFLGVMDPYFATLRNVSREDRLDAVSRLRLLELIEIRAMGWGMNENVQSYYKRKIAELEGTEKVPVALSQSQSCSSLISQAFTEQTSPIPVPLAPGELMRSSGKFMNPTKIAGKNYFKDEVVIRNSDSGKVMGIKGRRVHMIEELSDTIISFQRVNPGARDRRVQIAGPNEESISFAKTLVEDTIRRNASPVRERNDNVNTELNNCINMVSNMKMEDHEQLFPRPLVHSYSVGDAANEYTLSVQLYGEIVKLTGKNLQLLQVAKNLLHDNFPSEELSAPVPRPMNPSSNMSRSDYNRLPRSSLQRSVSCIEAFNGNRQTSISPLDSSSEDETSKEGDNCFKMMDLERSPMFALPVLDNNDNLPPPIPPPRIMYSRDSLTRMECSPLCRAVPPIDPMVWTIYPMMLRDNVVQSSEVNSQDSSL